MALCCGLGNKPFASWKRLFWQWRPAPGRTNRATPQWLRFNYEDPSEAKGY